MPTSSVITARTTCWPSTSSTSAAASMSFSQRSEEHTSELQSPCNLVCRLLLEKKKSTSCLRNADAKSPGVRAKITRVRRRGKAAFTSERARSRRVNATLHDDVLYVVVLILRHS